MRLSPICQSVGKRRTAKVWRARPCVPTKTALNTQIARCSGFRWEIVPWRAADGTVGGITIFSEDITAHKATEERMRLAASVFTHAAEGISITDPDGTILEVNEAFGRMGKH